MKRYFLFLPRSKDLFVICKQFGFKMKLHMVDRAIQKTFFDN